MYKIIGFLLVAVLLLCPTQVFAAEFTVNIHVMRQQDGTTCGELWYNDKVIWRMAILADGAKPVSGSYNTTTTLIAPDIINGFFLIKVQ